MIRFACVAAVMLASIAVSANQAHAQAPLFSQYTTQGAGSPSAAMYPAPHWSPILGAESYYTYQPLMPHEMMYQHSRNYYNYYDGGYKGGGHGLVKTSVRWQAGNQHMGPLPFSTGLSGAIYKLNARKYNIPGGTGAGLGIGGCGPRGCGGRGLLRGGFGCKSGTCTPTDAYSSDPFIGDAAAGAVGDWTADAGSAIAR